MYGKNVKQVIVISIQVCLVAWVIRYIWLNTKYPNPTERVTYEKEKVTIGDYTLMLKSIEWYDGSIINEILPGYVLLYDSENNPYPIEGEKVALATIEFTKNVDLSGDLNLTVITFEAGAWHNQWDLELFNALNNGAGVYVDLEYNTPTEFIFPIVMYDFKFPEEEWETIEEDGVDIILAYYPEKYILRMSNTE